MELYADPITVNCRKVVAGLDFIGAPYTLKHIDYFKSEQKSPEFMALNPNAALPTLVDGDFVLWESNAILQYAADKIGNTAAYPTDLRTRADINRWLLWESSAWFPSCYVFLVEHCVKPLFEAQPDQSLLDAQAEIFHKLAGILDARLATTKFIVGNTPTIADLALAAPMHLHPFQKLPLDTHSHLRRWMVEHIEPMPCWQHSYVGEGFTRERKTAA
ncbi:MAG: hypothetical protein B7X48_09945 [Acidiphilium sp. 34-60-192]|nr:MAG: hypothetical protein B7X48_09945 [Acidiphilium sp. 34-60-192]